MGALTSGQFMAALPAAVRPLVPPAVPAWQVVHRSWLCQFHWGEPRVHFEVWNLGVQRGWLELGLHFEHPDRQRNRLWLAHCSRHMPEIKATLGPSWEAEMWDKGWSKVYALLPHHLLSAAGLPLVAAQLAGAITLLYPLWQSAPTGAESRPARPGSPVW